MNSPLKKKFSNFEEQCQSKLKLLSQISEAKQTPNPCFMSLLRAKSQRPSQKPLLLNSFDQHLNVIFQQEKQKTIIIPQSVLAKILVKGSSIIVMVEINVEVTVTLVINWNGFDKKKLFKFDKTKAIPLQDYQNGDARLQFFLSRQYSFVQARVRLDSIKCEFEQKKPNVISPKRIKLQIDRFIEQNKGRGAQILQRRSLSRQSSSQQRLLRTETRRVLSSASSTKSLVRKQTYRPINILESKKDISEFHLFEVQKKKYLTHIKKMCSEKEDLLKKTQSFYVSKKEEQIKNMVSWILLNRFFTVSRLKLIQLMKDRLKRIKVSMLVTDFCILMKSKLRFKITQKARFRMAVRQPILFLGETFYKTNITKAENQILNLLKQIQGYKTILRTCQKSKNYLQKTMLIQKYFRKKRQNISDRIDIILNRLLETSNKGQKDLKMRRQILKQQYLKKCIKENRKSWVIGLYSNKYFLLQNITS